MNKTEELLQRSIQCDFTKIINRIKNLIKRSQDIISDDYILYMKELKEIEGLFEVFENSVIRIFKTRDAMELANRKATGSYL